MRKKLTRPGVRSMIAQLAIIVAMLAASVPIASAHQGQSGKPGHLSGKNSASHQHSGRPGHAGHSGAPGA